MKQLELKQVSKDFQQGNSLIRALRTTDFSAKAGEFIALIGPSGSGKSTFLTLAGGLQTPSTGQVEVGQAAFSQTSEKARAAIRLERIGFILQASNLIPFLTVIDQLRLHKKVQKAPFDLQEAERLLESLGILSLKDKYPAALSGGEKQRVAIARAIFHHPQLILADEPTASLDTPKATEVVELLANLAKRYKTCIIMVTHDERMIEYCDAVYRMEDGVLSQDAGHQRKK